MSNALIMHDMVGSVRDVAYDLLFSRATELHQHITDCH